MAENRDNSFRQMYNRARNTGIGAPNIPWTGRRWIYPNTSSVPDEIINRNLINPHFTKQIDFINTINYTNQNIPAKTKYTQDWCRTMGAAAKAYEIYHGMKPGTAKESDIICSSAGLYGWASASFADMESQNEKVIKKMKKKNRRLKRICLKLISDFKKYKDGYTVEDLDHMLLKLENKLKYY